ncbi:MAG: [Firmicutes bacterium]|nr:[FeFe] hydrogenase H-cluster radical SAM maturase HydE [Bacillota bacterium]
MDNLALLDLLEEQGRLERQQWVQLISTYTPEDSEAAAAKARSIAQSRFGRDIFFRGIVEISNYCRNDCYYCGIRRGNRKVARYRLSKEEILECCAEGYSAGFRTFVLQGGEDVHFTDEVMIDIVSAISGTYPECAITLSLGERSRESYQALFDAGARRYLLRHETADAAHYGLLHPAELSWQHRMDCLRELKDIGYQTGCGMMVGAPFQTADHLASDMMFMAEFKPQMIGTGPFLPHQDTPFRDQPAGSVELTLFLLSLSRLMLPDVLLPATTALGTARGNGRLMGVLHGANVIMPNLSPLSQRRKYMLYDNKPIEERSAEESIAALDADLNTIGYRLRQGRGDYQGRN